VPVKISVPSGLDPNNEAFEAIIPATGGSDVSRVDFYIEATRKVGGVVHRCEVIDNPFDYDDNAGYHIHSYVASPKQTGRIYQLLVRNFGARYNPGRQGQPGVQYDYSGTFCDVTDETIDSLKLMGFDTIWLSGVIDFDNSSGVRKGDAGSPYAARNFYRASPDLGCTGPGHHRYPQATAGEQATGQATKELAALMDRIHAKGLRVMIDLVPNHTSRNYENFASKVYGWEPDPLALLSRHYQYEYGQMGVKIIGNSKLIFGAGAGDWTDTYRLDYTNERTAAQLDDPVTTRKIAAGNSFNNSHPAAALEHSMYEILDRVVETWQSRGVDGFRIDFPHALSDDLWAYLTYNAKTRAEGHARHGGPGSKYPSTVIFVGEGYDLDGSYGPDSGAVGNSGSSWANMFAGGFDGIYDKNGLLDQVRNIYTQSWWAKGIGQRVRAETNDPFQYSRTVGNVGKTGAQALVRMMSNHDELQPASNEWAGATSDNLLKPRAATGAVVLLPGSSLLYNGQEVGEPAAIEDNYWCGPQPHPSPWCGSPYGDGKTSFFDYVLMPSLRRWLDHALHSREEVLRRFYSRLFNLIPLMPRPRGDLGYFDISNSQEWGEQPLDVQQWIYAAARARGSGANHYLILSNFSDVEKTVMLDLHYDGTTSMLSDLGIQNTAQQYKFTEVLSIEDENGRVRSYETKHRGDALYGNGRVPVPIPRWTTAVLLVTPS
jgi:glycosidase